MSLKAEGEEDGFIGDAPKEIDSNTYENKIIKENKIDILSNEQILPLEMNTEEIEIASTDHESYKKNNTNNAVLNNFIEMNSSIFELSRYSWQNINNKQLYTRGCLWSPDGTCVLTAVNLDGMHVFELPSDIYKNDNISNKRPLDILQSVIHVKEGGTVYDYCWYPLMDSNYPETCFWIATRQHEPIHMWDGYNGQLRCSYRGYDAVDEVETAISIAFSNDGSKILGGYKKSIKIFDTNIPGRDYEQINIKQPCSCFALHSLHNDLVTFGSWKSTIHICDLRSPNLGCLITLQEHIGGITYLKFTNDGKSLFSGARKDNQLIEWDMRNFDRPVTILKRNVNTNQRIYFDINSNDNYLISGDTKGVIHVWDLNHEFNENVFKLHHDCCNGISIHPTKSILATTSGQYHFLTEEEKNGNVIKVYENSLTLWWYGDIIDL